MQTIVEGNPGSGKSYFFVKYLLGYCKYDELYQEYVLREDVLIISNVDGLRIKHLSLDELLKKYTPSEFFTVENFERIQKQYKVKNIILGVDEAQKIFDSKFFDKNVFYLFQYHRHLGLDVFLITQSRSTLCRQLLPLCEYFVQAKPRSKGIGGTFSYNYLDPKGSYMYSKTLKTSPDVFRAYKSFNSDEMNKPRNVLKYYFVMGLILAVTAFCLLKYVLSWFNVRANSSKSAAVSKTVAPGSPSSSKPPVLPPRTSVSFAPTVHARYSSANLSPVSTSSHSVWLPLDMVYRDGNATLVSIRGYRGIYKIPCPDIAKVDLKNKTCVPSDVNSLIPL